MQFKRLPTRQLSIVLVTYNMSRELPRTLMSLMKPFQRGIDSLDYEIIVVDNCSTNTAFRALGSPSGVPLVFLEHKGPSSQSPVKALNYGISVSSGQTVCACIDGARMFSPGLISQAMRAASLGPRTVIGTLSYHLGRIAQNVSVHHGYDQVVEDRLLQTVPWEYDGYQLFRIASLDPSSRWGQFGMPAETNSLFMSRELWEECGAFDESFVSKGGGLANLDIWRRLGEEERNEIVLLLGEGTFHQFHGGAATNARIDPWTEMHDEYRLIRKKDFSVAERAPCVFGAANKFFKEFFKDNNGIDPEWEK